MTHEAPAEPVLRAAGLSLRTKRGPVFDDLTLDVPAGSVAALCGPAGSGRSMALLALAGRAATTGGELAVAGVTALGVIRRLVSVARIGGAVELEPDLTVGDLVRERRLLGARGDAPEWKARSGDLVGDLPDLDALLLAVALAAMDRPAVIVVDDVDLRLDDADRAAAWAALDAVAAEGPAVVASAVQPPAGAAVTMLARTMPSRTVPGGPTCAS
jgi:ABC-2 type transport system ATP-binding protein